MPNDDASVLNFNTYVVDEFTFRLNEKFDKEKQTDVPLNFAFNGNFSINEQNDKALVMLSCQIFDENLSDSDKPFYLKSSIRGHFEVAEGINISDFQLNCIAILLPYLRAIVTSFTAQANVPPVIMPAINVHNLVQNNQEHE